MTEMYGVFVLVDRVDSTILVEITLQIATTAILFNQLTQKSLHLRHCEATPTTGGGFRKAKNKGVIVKLSFGFEQKSLAKRLYPV